MAPGDLRVAGTGPTWIEWAWAAVSGASGYEAQFSHDPSFTSEDPTFLKTAAETSHRVENLPGATSGLFRVRTLVGSGSNAVRSDWSATVSGMTDAAGPAPGPTPLATPGNLRATGQGDDRIDLAWNGVPDADGYEIEQRVDGATAWSSASCGGSDNLVDGTSCAVTGLDRGTAYDFRVRALPDLGDDRRAVSAWLETASAISTTGTPAAPPVSSGGGDLNVTWTSNRNEVTWFWDQADDRAANHETALLDKEIFGARTCPDPDSSRWTNQGASTRLSDPNVEAGEVLLLCVRTRSGDAVSAPSFAWATIPTDPGAVTPSDANGRTTAISVSGIELSPGFRYVFRRVATSVIDTSFAISDCEGGTALGTESSDIAIPLDAYRMTGLASYTRYGLCYRAETDSGESAWRFTPTGALTLPGAPSTPSAVSSSLAAGSVTLEWTVATRDRADVPRSGTADNYNFRVLSALATGPDPTAADCSTPGNDVIDTGRSVNPSNTQDGFLATTRLRAAPRASTDYSLCVQAKLSNDRTGPWTIGQEIRIAGTS